jgi:hypothetical protein
MLLLTLLGCSKEKPSLGGEHLNGAVLLHRFVDGKKVQETKLQNTGIELRQLRDWLDSHEDGWIESNVSYAPQSVIRGEGFSINFMKSGEVILNEGSPTFPKNRQFRRTESKPFPSFISAP